MYAEAVSIEDRLRTALSSDRLNPEQSARAEALLSRLVSPVRIAVLGRRGAGKSSVVNLLAGAPVLPQGVPLPTAQLSWAVASETTCTYADKSRRSFADATTAELSEGQPIFIALGRNLPALRRVALLEVVMDGSPSAQARALAWAAARCDIAIWCSRSFDDVEQALWAAMPAALQKHAILALTHSDTLRSHEARAHHLDQTCAQAAGSFFCVLPVQANVAVAALSPGAAPNADQLTATGAQALLNTIFDKVDAGYARVREAAETLLDDAVLQAARAIRPTAEPEAPRSPAATPAHDETAKSNLGYAPPTYIPPVPQEVPPTTIHRAETSAPRHGIEAHLVQQEGSPHLAEPAADYTPPAAPGSPQHVSPQPASPQHSGPEAANPAPLNTAPTSPAPTDSGPVTPAPQPPFKAETAALIHASAASDDAPVEDTPPQAGVSTKKLSEDGRATVVEAISYLAKRGEVWGKVARHNPDAASRQIMEEVLGDAEWLASYLDDPFEDDEALLAPCRDMAVDIVDLVQLMEIERTETATVDAVCLLLQARRRLQALAAAA